MTGLDGTARCLRCAWHAAGDGADRQAESHTRTAGHATAVEWRPVPLDGVSQRAIGRATGADEKTVRNDLRAERSAIPAVAGAADLREPETAAEDSAPPPPVAVDGRKAAPANATPGAPRRTQARQNPQPRATTPGAPHRTSREPRFTGPSGPGMCRVSPQATAARPSAKP